MTQRPSAAAAVFVVGVGLLGCPACSAELDQGSPEGPPGPGGGESDEQGCEADTLDAEGCACADSGATRSCYPGTAASAGVDACTMGTQACLIAADVGEEFATGAWGPCEGAGAPLTCETAGATCGSISDGCGGQLTCGAVCEECSPGSIDVTSPGSSTFTVPTFETLTVELWGGGGGATAYAEVDRPTAGGDSSFDGTVTAGGGGAGDSSAEAPGGTAAGGDVNLPGGPGAPACAQYLDTCAGRRTRTGGDSPNGGAGGTQITSLDACAALMFGSAAGDGEDGHEPGGGGGGDNTCQFDWLNQQGWGMTGAGGGAGGYVSITYSAGDLTAGANVPVVVGAGGRGSMGAT